MSGARSWLTASKRRLAVVAVVGLLVLVGGAVVAGILGAPSVTGVDNRFAGVNETTTVIESDLAVRNPNPLGVTLGGLTADYRVTMNGIAIANGTKSGVTVARGTDALPFTTFLDNERIPAWWVSHVNAGERTTLRVDADVHSSLLGASFGAPEVEREVETNVVGAFNSTERRPVNLSLPVVSDPVLYVEETSGEWGTVDANRTEVETDFVVSNPKPYPVPIAEIGYEIRMNGIRMGQGTTAREYVIPPGGERRVEATTVMRTARFDEWWVSHLERDQRTTLEIDFYLVVDPQTGGAGSARVPLDTLTQTVETDIFGNKDGTAGSRETTPTGDGTATPAPTASPTPTPTPTPTDDGLLGGGSTDGGTSTQTSTPSGNETATETPTPTDDGILLAVDRDG
ncbi:MAG: conserved secreted protein [uncultured archaeon A07HB70]|nr:MAG: conserved secreted protein [uncultured archaeon A07HB70]